MEANLNGRRAVVTGAGRGVGAAAAIGLAGAGAEVVMVARSHEQLEAAASQIRESGAGSALLMVADLADAADTRRVAAELSAGPVVSVLINNAAMVEPLGPTTAIDLEQARAAFELNVVAVIALTAAVIPKMIGRGRGRIVNVSSGIVASPGGMVGGNVYAATKAALEAHTLNLATELAGTGVTANVYRPGRVDTAMQEWIRDQDPERIGAELHQRFVASKAAEELITAEESARHLVDHLLGPDAEQTGRIWDQARVLPH